MMINDRMHDSAQMQHARQFWLDIQKQEID